MSFYLALFASVFVFIFLVEVNGGPWASSALEKLDEENDAEIYKAVFTSVQQWKLRQKMKNRHREKRQASNICYKDVGCFESSGPHAYLDVLPSSPEEVATKFFLYPAHRNRKNGFPHAEIAFANISEAFKWAQQGFNKSLPTKVLIHGFGSDCTHIWVYELRSALMAVEELNVICVDWAKGAELPNYVKAAANTRLVGKQLAILLKGLVEHSGLLPKNIHLIGFSLGAHVAGFTGAEIGNLSRITGLDPAGPLFESQDPRARLDQTDAEFVDVIHSNGENLILGGLGCWQPLGHVDFYPNGGRMQKGCSNIFVGAVSDIIWSSAVEGRSLCNHRRAYKFFTDSVSPRCLFPAFPCESYEAFLEGRCFPCTDEKNCGNMGYYADRAKGRGKLYLITRDEEPFCAHQYHVKIESSPSELPITSYGKIQITLVGDSDLNETFVMTKKDDEEMKLGRSLSRILVPHPVLAEPTHIQVLYTAYSGWLSSGLAYWKIDKITLSDSYGKSSSICKRSLILESGVPVTLPLYPGQCNLPSNEQTAQADDRIWKDGMKNATLKDLSHISKFVPTPIIKIGNEIISKGETKIALQDAMELFGNLPWQQIADERSNRLEDEKESSRALNTRVVTVPTGDNEEVRSKYSTGVPIKEVVEPVLKPHSNKIARSHDPNKLKHEISEPILGSTTNRINDMLNLEAFKRKEFINEDWISSSKLQNEPKSRDKWKRQENLNAEPFGIRQAEPTAKPDILTMTVQFLPQRLAKMFEEAEKYARETLLPFVSAHTPKIIRDFISPDEKPKYLPLHFDDTFLDDTDSDQVISSFARNFDSSDEIDKESVSIATPYTHIQKISKRGEKITLQNSPSAMEENEDSHTSTTTNFQTVSTTQISIIKFDVDTSKPGEENQTGLYVDLPVFDKDYKTLKYIPFIRNENTSITK